MNGRLSKYRWCKETKEADNAGDAVPLLGQLALWRETAQQERARQGQ